MSATQESMQISVSIVDGRVSYGLRIDRDTVSSRRLRTLSAAITMALNMLALPIYHLSWTGRNSNQ